MLRKRRINIIIFHNGGFLEEIFVADEATIFSLSHFWDFKGTVRPDWIFMRVEPLDRH